MAKAATCTNGDIHLLDARGMLRGVFTLDQAEQVPAGGAPAGRRGPAR